MEITESSECALLWVLWHHQGGSSEIGGAIRFVFGMGMHDRMTEEQVVKAKKWPTMTHNCEVSGGR